MVTKPRTIIPEGYAIARIDRAGKRMHVPCIVRPDGLLSPIATGKRNHYDACTALFRHLMVEEAKRICKG